MTLSIMGAGMLWVGWFGFNGGSALAANGDAGMAMLVTHISAAAGACTWMLLERINHGKASALGAVTGMVAGLGTITPASGFVGPGGGLITGYIKRTLKIDDSLDVFPVHGVGGILGTLLTGVFASNALGVFGGQEDIAIGAQVSTQTIGIVSAIVYTAVVTFVILKVADILVGNRVDEEDEMQGLDLVSHDERGYDL
jgi:Amt family ammonium transporter